MRPGARLRMDRQCDTPHQKHRSSVARQVGIEEHRPRIDCNQVASSTNLTAYAVLAVRVHAGRESERNGDVRSDLGNASRAGGVHNKKTVGTKAIDEATAVLALTVNRLPCHAAISNCGSKERRHVETAIGKSCCTCPAHVHTPQAAMSEFARGVTTRGC